MFNITYLLNWKELSRKKKLSVYKANLHENKSRINYNYCNSSQAYVTSDGIQRKLDSSKAGPFLITEVYTNGTVRIQQGAINKRINIRRLEPHLE